MKYLSNIYNFYILVSFLLIFFVTKLIHIGTMFLLQFWTVNNDCFSIPNLWSLNSFRWPLSNTINRTDSTFKTNFLLFAALWIFLGWKVKLYEAQTAMIQTMLEALVRHNKLRYTLFLLNQLTIKSKYPNEPITTFWMDSNAICWTRVV